MNDTLVLAAFAVLVTVALGLLRIARGPTRFDRLMAVQLLGSGGVAVLLLLAVGTATASLVDIALTLALLAAFASVSFAAALKRAPAGKSGGTRR